MSYSELSNRFTDYSHILSRYNSPKEIVHSIGKEDKKNKTKKLASLFRAIVEIPEFDGDERLKALAAKSYEYLKKHKKLRGEKASFKACTHTFKHPVSSKPVEERQSQPKEKVETVDSGGIANAGNSCYFGATLQALRHCKDFVHVVKTKEGVIPKIVNNLFEIMQGTFDETRGVGKDAMRLLLECARSKGFKERLGDAGDAITAYTFLLKECGINDDPIYIFDDTIHNRAIDLVSYCNQRKILNSEVLPSPLTIAIPPSTQTVQGSLGTVVHTLQLDWTDEHMVCSYTLKAVVTSGGHACCWVPIQTDGVRKWMLYDDAAVSVVADDAKTQEIICKSAYLLFFDLESII